MKRAAIVVSVGLLMGPITGVAQHTAPRAGNQVYCMTGDSIVPATARSTGAPQRGSIAIIAVEHAPGQFRSSEFSPAHVRASLDALDPQVVAVESNPGWFREGRYYRSTYEAQGVTAPWARERGVPVCGIDWVGTLNPLERALIDQGRKEWERSVPGAELDPAAYQYGLASWSDLESPDGATTGGFPLKDGEQGTFQLMNNPGYGARWLGWIDAERPNFNQLFMRVRDDHIVAHIVAVTEAYPGARLAVVIGAAHKADLERKLRAKGHNVVGLEAVERRYPLGDGRRMDSLLTAQDIAAILSEAWDATRQPRISRERTERLVARLGSAAGTDQQARVWNAYFQARHRMLNGDLPAARAALLKVADEGTHVRFPHPGWRWRQHLTIQQAAWLELGRIADLQGHRDEAVANYRRLLRTITVPEYSENFFSDYLFMVTAHNAVRALLRNPYASRTD